MIIVFMGPQGSGKGTQARKLAEELDIYYFDMGKFLREEAKNNPLIDEYVNKKGKFIPEDISSPLALEKLSKIIPERDHIIFDGFPRSTKQLKYLDDWLNESKTKISLIVYIQISPEESVKRLSSRRICKSCGKIYNLESNPPPTPQKCECGGELYQRQDDKPEAIKERLKWSKDLEKDLIKVYKERGIFQEFDGERPIEVIFSDILKSVSIQK